MQEGSLRCDVNLSVRKKGETKFGTRTETKNLNSFKAIGRAIEFEIDRQIKELENGGTIYQETRRWDDDKGIGYAMRTKEDAHDYRYFPEPDLAPIVLSDDYVNGIQDGLPEMPNVRRERYITELGLPEYDATQITNSKKMAEFFDKATKKCGNAKLVSNWLMSDVSRKLNEAELEIDNIKFTAEDLGDLITLIEKGTISSAIAKKVFETMFETGDAPAKIVEAQGLVQITDESAIRDLVISVINENEQSVQDFINGKDKAVGFIVGQTMKASKGKANPGIVNKLIMEELNKRKNG
jgi:aspartyl-tRNA(Asn)/glutamyl-tRNA(Gln) amidotransferase subunit B